MKSDRLSPRRMDALARQLAFVRVAGSAGERRALQIVATDLTVAGLAPVREPFPVRTYSIGAERLALLDPFAAEIPCAAVAFAGRTPLEGTEAPLVFVESAQPDLLAGARGCIALTFRIPLSVAKYRELGAAGIAGLVRITEPGQDLLYQRVPPLWEQRFRPVPMAFVRYADGERLIRRRVRRARLTVHYRTRTATSHTLVLDLPGLDPAAGFIALGAHIDSTHIGPGAMDNAAGSAALVELARFFSRHRLRCGLRFLWLGSEEIGCVGSYEYVRSHRAELTRDCRLYVNLDVTGSLVGREEVMAVGPDALLERVRRLAGERKLALQASGFDPGNMTDIQPFCTAGVPALAFERVGGYGDAVHTRRDAPRHMGPSGFRSAEIVRQLVNALAADPALDELGPVPEAIRAELRRIYVERDGLAGEDRIFQQSICFMAGD